MNLFYVCVMDLFFRILFVVMSVVDFVCLIGGNYRIIEYILCVQCIFFNMSYWELYKKVIWLCLLNIICEMCMCDRGECFEGENSELQIFYCFRVYCIWFLFELGVYNCEQVLI